VEKLPAEQTDAPTASESSESGVPPASAAPASASANAAPSSVTPAVNSSAEVLKGRRVLVLDDEESLRQLLHEGLSAQGLRVDCAATVEEALALIRRFWESGQNSFANGGDNGGRSSDAVASSPENVASSPESGRRPSDAVASSLENRYDILLCDLHLSAGGYFVDGREAAALLLEASAAAHAPKPAVIYMTGDLTDPAAAETPARGEPSFLQKPFRISEVLALFREVLATAEPQPK